MKEYNFTIGDHVKITPIRSEFEPDWLQDWRFLDGRSWQGYIVGLNRDKDKSGYPIVTATVTDDDDINCRYKSDGFPLEYFEHVNKQERNPLEVGYTNWEDRYAFRKLEPQNIWYGSSEWHKEPQWFLKAFDLESNKTRDFALKDFGTRKPLVDGGFMCVPDEAVKVAHMMNCAESIFDEANDGWETLEFIRDYLQGRLSEDEVIEIFHREWPEIFHGLKEEDEQE